MPEYTAIPTGRNLLVKKHPAQEAARIAEPDGFSESSWEIPEDFEKKKRKMDRFELVEVVAVGEGVEGVFRAGQTVVAETSMLETVSGPAGAYSFIGENYIPLKFTEE